jgi:hypothetical protein
MRITLPDGELDPRIVDDPRWSQAQREAALAVARADPRAHVAGLDQKMRPVIRARLDGPGNTEYALLRNGDPAKPVKPLQEVWRNSRRAS